MSRTYDGAHVEFDGNEELVNSSGPAKMEQLQQTQEECQESDAPTENESSDERRRLQEEESLELARMLMAEEALASYHHSVQMLQESRDQLSQEDYQALEVALREEDQGDETQQYEDEEGNISYETLLQIGERIGDVKSDRWAIVAQSVIDQLPIETYNAERVQTDADDSEFKCLICQHEYNCNDELRRLPCGHCFHVECVDQWLSRTDLCPYCRTSIKNEA